MELTPIMTEDWPTVNSWLQDKELLRKVMVEPPNISLPVFTMLIRLKTGEPVGWIDIFNIDLCNAKAQVGIAIPDDRGRGLSYRAGKKAIDFAFRELGLHRLEARIAASNHLPRRLCAMLGFAMEGCEKEACFKGDHWEDVCVYGLLNPHYRGERQVN